MHLKNSKSICKQTDSLKLFRKYVTIVIYVSVESVKFTFQHVYSVDDTIFHTATFCCRHDIYFVCCCRSHQINRFFRPKTLSP